MESQETITRIEAGVEQTYTVTGSITVKERDGREKTYKKLDRPLPEWETYRTQEAERHLREFRPKQYKELVESGKMVEYLTALDERFIAAEEELVNGGVDPMTAESILMRELVYTTPEPESEIQLSAMA